MGIPDARVGVYLWFAAEASFMAALLGASTVLWFSGTDAAATRTHSLSPLAWLAAAFLALHIVTGITWQISASVNDRTRKIFWALTAILLLMAMPLFLVR